MTPVSPRKLALGAERIATDRLEFHEVVEVDEMRQLAGILNLPMRSQHPVDVEVG